MKLVARVTKRESITRYLAGDTGTGAGAALVAPACRSSLHAFDFFLRRATPSGGFGVTCARHDEHAPKTP